MRRLTSLLVATTLGAAALALPATAATSRVDFEARTILPPGNSFTYTVDGQAAGAASGDPDAYGTNVDDQREMYWAYEFKDGGFRDECDEPEVPRPGVRVCFDEFGVPAVYADTVEDVWFGAGYAAAKIRLFLLDATVRTARGTLSELTGAASVPEDVATRVTGYSEAELTALYDRTASEGRRAVDGYVDGVNTWVDAVLASGDLPAEYALLSSTPQRITKEDVVATGVLMTRFVASEGGTEMANVAALRELEETYGTEEGRDRFLDLVWTEDGAAALSIPPEDGVFPRTSLPASERDRVFRTWADYAATLPLALADGPGTGAYPEPLTAEDGAPGLPNPGAQAAAALEQFRAQLDGGSWAVALSPSRTSTGQSLLISEPQLGYSPTLLVELEVHGAGYDARGVSVAGIPTVGIGYGERVAWALTTGNAKTIDSFIETTRPDSNGDGAPEYLHDGVWKDQECRTEDVAYRAAQQGAPVGPAAFTESVQVCRTVHGPVVATTEDGSLARSVQYHMFGREIETIEGVLRWNRADTLEEFEEAMRLVTWNENTVYADADGNIAFWHPGVHRERNPETDPRLPLPGTGEWDLGEPLAFDELPQTVNPSRGFVANWNNKPALGWGDGVGMSTTSYPAGHGQRVTNLLEILPTRTDWDAEGLRAIDRFASSYDMRAREFLPLLLALRDRSDLTATERAGLDLLAAWDGSANGAGADMRHTEGETATVGAAATLFEATMRALVDDLLTGDSEAFDTLVARQSRSGRHVYDVSPALNLALRALDPATSTLTPSRDYLGGRAADDVLRDVLGTAVATLAAAQGEDPTTWRSDYRMESVCSPTKVIGPCVEMPFLERGTWIHMVAYGASEDTGEGPDDETPGSASPVGKQPLPATGPAVPAALAGASMLAAAAVVSRRRHA